MQDQELLKRWARLIKPLFPKNAQFRSRLKGGDYPDYQIDIIWPPSDTPQELSKKLQIIIEREFIEDYLVKEQKIQDDIDNRIIEHIELKLTQFDPYYSRSEEWYIPSNLIEKKLI